MAGLAGNPVIGTVDLYTSNASQGNTALGQLIFGDSGKAFRYVKAGASDLVVGNVLQSQAVDAQFTNMTVPSAIAAGQTTVVVTNGTTVVTADEFKDGTLSVYTAGTTAIGLEYTILGNSSAANGAALTLYLDRPLRTGWSTAAKVNVRWSPWYKVIQSPATTLTGSCAGVAIYPIVAGEYGWVQTKGVGAVLSDGSSILVGSPVAVPSGTAGATILGAAGLFNIGQAMQAAASAHAIAVNLRID
jgi:predicted RecA/RadA family phage recombinase